MKHQIPKIIFWLVTALALSYSAFFVYGVTLVGFRLMAPWASLEFALIALALASHSASSAAKCRSLKAEMAVSG